MAGDATHALSKYLHHLSVTARVEHLPDRTLIEFFLARHDGDAFAALVRRHGPMVLRVCQCFLQDVHDAEDVFQAVFLVLSRKAASLRRADSVGSFLHGVAYRLAKKARTQILRQRHRQGPAAAEKFADDPLDEVSVREAQAIVDEELAHLPEKYRAPLLLCCLQGKTRDEAAHQLGWTAKLVKSRLQEGRQRLRSRLLRRGLTLPAAWTAILLVEEAVPAALPASLLRLAVQSAAGATNGIAPSIAQLAASALGGMGTVKLKLFLGLLLLTSILAVGMGALVPSREHQPTETNPLPHGRGSDAPRGDRLGDPLPPGAVARFGTVRFRHGNSIYGLALSPDGRVLATVGGCGFVRLWDAATGKELRSLIRENPWTTGDMAAFSPDGRIIATSGQTGVSLWQADNGRWLRDLEANNIYSLAFSPDGKTLAALDCHQGPSLWNVASGKKIAQLAERAARRGARRAGHHALAFTPDGTRLASTYQSSVILWDVAAQREVRRLENPNKKIVQEVHAVAFTPDGKRLASGGQGGTIRLWDAATGRELRAFKGHEVAVTSLAFSADGRTLFSGSGYSSVFGLPGEERRALRVWDVATGAEREPLGEHLSGVLALARTADGSRIISAEGGSVRRWDIGTRKEVHPRIGHHNWIGTVAFAPDGKCVATAGGDRTIRLWEAATGRELRTLDAAEEVDSVTFSPDGKRIASGSRDGVIRLWEASSGREVRRIRAHERELWVAFSPDGTRLASASRDATAALWDVATGKELRRFRGDYDGFMCVAFSPDGKRIAAGEIADKSEIARQPHEPAPVVRVWDVMTGKQIYALRGHKHIIIHGVAFSPDGTVLVSTGWDKTTHLWDMATGRALGQIPAGGEAVAFSPDGQMLATGDFDDRVRLWEVATRKERLHFAGHRAYISGLAFAPDGRTLLSGSMDTTALLWDLRGLSRPAGKFDRESCWRELADGDAAKAYRAMTALAAVPEQTVPLLRQRVPVVRPPDPQRLERLLAELDSDRFEAREKAMKQIESIGELTAPALRKVLADKPSLEVRRRVELLLMRIKPAHSPEQLGALRAVEVLEQIGTPEAQKVLQTLANGASEARLTRQAKAALERMKSAR